MKYVTVKMVAEKARRHPESVSRAMKASQVPVERFPGVKGGRILLREANKFLARHWPEAGQMGEGAQ